MIGVIIFTYLIMTLIDVLNITNELIVFPIILFWLYTSFRIWSYVLSNGYSNIFKHMNCNHEYEYKGTSKYYWSKTNGHPIHKCKKCGKQR